MSALSYHYDYYSAYNLNAHSTLTYTPFLIHHAFLLCRHRPNAGYLVICPPSLLRARSSFWLYYRLCPASFLI
jgi:hypothetical protein